jgi:hypothetical protein
VKSRHHHAGHCRAPRAVVKPRKPFGRPVHIDGEEWRYKISSAGVRIRTPQGGYVFVDMCVFTGFNNEHIERAHWKGYWTELGPGDVKTYIEKYEVEGAPCPGSGTERIPPFVEGTEDQVFPRRQFKPEQFICPSCGRRIEIVGWSMLSHERPRGRRVQ